MRKTEFAYIIQNSSNQLLSIVNDILTVSALETNQEVLVSEKIDLDEMFLSIYEFYSSRCLAKDIKLELNIGNKSGQTYIFSDKTKLNQIVSNLLNNAVKFTYQGSISFGFDLLTPLKGQKTSILKGFVIDTGIGIAPEHHSIIFDRFRQADISISQQYGGTGLGLSITKGFIELLDGNIEVESALNVGSKFMFDIPVELLPNNLMQQPEILPVIEKQLFNNKSILVAEDEPYNYKLIEEIFCKYPVSLVHARNRKEAVNHCLNNN